MELTLPRGPVIAAVDGVVSNFAIDGIWGCYALERASLKIPAGRYLVVMTVSDRASKGILWTPDPEHRLPQLLAVPGRTGIRIHAANFAKQVEGCIAVGLDRVGPGGLGRSQDALRWLMGKLVNQHVWITVTDNPTA